MGQTTKDWSKYGESDYHNGWKLCPHPNTLIPNIFISMFDYGEEGGDTEQKLISLAQVKSLLIKE